MIPLPLSPLYRLWWFLFVLICNFVSEVIKDEPGIELTSYNSDGGDHIPDGGGHISEHGEMQHRRSPEYGANVNVNKQPPDFSPPKRVVTFFIGRKSGLTKEFTKGVAVVNFGKIFCSVSLRWKANCRRDSWPHYLSHSCYHPTRTRMGALFFNLITKIL